MIYDIPYIFILYDWFHNSIMPIQLTELKSQSVHGLCQGRPGPVSLI